ncbi:MAG: hypothetical protein K6G07_00900, partial [Lachnospiraceae bacterium]|nr:hypothetical protein [Lachnospiraceae bacterium]
MKKKKKEHPNLIYLFVYLDFMTITILVAIFLRQTFFYALLVGELALPFLSRYIASRVFDALSPEMDLLPLIAHKNNEARLRIRI